MTLFQPLIVAEQIDEAFERIQLDPKGITPEHVRSARRSIRLLLTTWNNDSVLFWKVASGQQHTVTQGDASFTLPAGQIDILQMSVLRDGALVPVDLISRSDWFSIPDRVATPQVQGMPRMCWVERLASTVVAHFYPAAENSTDILVYDVMQQFNDSGQLSTTADIPFEWGQAFVSGLTAFLAEKFNAALYPAKQRKYGGPGFVSPRGQGLSDYEVARMGNRERGDTILIAAKSRRWRR